MVELDKIEKMRRLGLTDRTSAGAEAVRVTAQCRGALAGHSRESWRSTLQAWERDVERKLASHGGELVKGSLSITGQTVEAIVPVDELPSIVDEMTDSNVRLDVVVPRQIVTED